MKLQEKGLICFEEITDYSILTDQKVNFLLSWVYYHLNATIDYYINFKQKLKNKLKRKNAEHGFDDELAASKQQKKKKQKLDKNANRPKQLKASKGDKEAEPDEIIEKVCDEKTTTAIANGPKSKKKKRKDLREKRKKLNLKKNKVKIENKEANILKKKKKSQKSNSTSKISLQVENEDDVDELTLDNKDFETSIFFDEF